MAIRNLINFHDERFRKKSKEVVKFDERLWELLDDMRDTLNHVKGYRCTAVHVGVLRQAVIVIDKGGVIELINPRIIEASSRTKRVMEGSIAPGAPRGYVERPSHVTVSAVNRHGEPVSANATEAEIVQKFTSVQEPHKASQKAFEKLKRRNDELKRIIRKIVEQNALG